MNLNCGKSGFKAGLSNSDTQWPEKKKWVQIEGWTFNIYSEVNFKNNDLKFCQVFDWPIHGFCVSVDTQYQSDIPTEIEEKPHPQLLLP